MNNIQTSKIVERELLLYLNRKTLGNQNCSNGFEHGYSKLFRFSLNLVEEQSHSRIKQTGLSSTKSKGLSLSSKKQQSFKKQLHDQNNMFNPEDLKESHLIKRKTASTLVKTAHTIHYLGRSLSKSKQDVNLSNQRSQEKNISNKKIIESYHILSNSLRNQQNSTIERDSSFSLNKERHYTVTVTPPKQNAVVYQSKGYSQQSKDSKVGKIHQLKKKEFLRSSKKENIAYKNQTLDSKNNKLQSPLAALKTSQKQFQVKSRKQFLESYIDKPMINSIIVSANIDNLPEEPQSPVLRLKKRLEINSINCIFQRQTLVSNQVHENRSSRIQVQQSMIVHRNVAQNIRPLMHKINLFSEGEDLPYKLYLGQQVYSNLVLTVKEMPLEHFQKFARQLRIYHQIQSNRLQTKNILELIKHSTDSDKHVLLKEPFTETLNDYLQNFVIKKVTRLEFEYVVDSILRIVKKMVDTFEERCMVLKRSISLNDFVFVFLNLKFQNLEMFQMGNTQKLNKEKVLEEFRQEVENYFNRISSGSLDL